MKKIIIFIVFTLLLAGCTNLAVPVQDHETLLEKENKFLSERINNCEQKLLESSECPEPTQTDKSNQQDKERWKDYNSVIACEGYYGEKLSQTLSEEDLAVFDDNPETSGLGDDNVYQVCYTSRLTAAVLYGGYKNGNNKLIIKKQGNITEEFDVYTDEIQCPGMGDIGLVRIMGLLDDRLIYQCSGGDGPLEFLKIFAIDEQGQVIKLKDCGNLEGDNPDFEWTCETNLIDF